jgi:hypothetical protein
MDEFQWSLGMQTSKSPQKTVPNFIFFFITTSPFNCSWMFPICMGFNAFVKVSFPLAAVVLMMTPKVDGNAVAAGKKSFRASVHCRSSLDGVAWTECEQQDPKTGFKQEHLM